jgi:hypothetical protein
MPAVFLATSYSSHAWHPYRPSCRHYPVRSRRFHPDDPVTIHGVARAAQGDAVRAIVTGTSTQCKLKRI